MPTNNRYLQIGQQIWRAEQDKQAMPAALQRTEDTDYTSGYFFVTLNVRSEYPVLSTVHGRYNTLTHSAEDVSVELSDLGQAVEKNWQTLSQYHPAVQVLGYVVMPEHTHALLYLSPDGTEHLGKIIGGFMIGCTHDYWDVLGIPWRDMKKQTDPDQFDATWADRDHRTSKRGPSLFVKGYNDTIPITPDEVETKVEYIRTNPERRIIKGVLHDRFAVARDQHSANWTDETIIRGLRWDWKLSHYPEEMEKALSELRPRLLRRESDASPALASTVSHPGLALSYVGHRPLLMESRKLPLICHRADAGRFEEQAAAVLREARNGAVIVSAFISPKERDILKRLLIEQLPVIHICDNGFSDRYKPGGKSFYACAEDRLLQITCWKYKYYKENHICTRPECMVMNELARIISKTEDDWWKK